MMKEYSAPDGPPDGVTSTGIAPENIPLAPRVPASTIIPPVEEVEPPKPSTHWNVREGHKGHRGIKADLVKEIEIDERIPEHWKSALLTEIEKRDCKALEIHVHAQDAGHGFMLSIHLKEIF